MWCRNLHARERRLIGQNLQLCLNPLVPVLQLLRAEGGKQRASATGWTCPTA